MTERDQCQRRRGDAPTIETHHVQDRLSRSRDRSEVSSLLVQQLISASPEDESAGSKKDAKEREEEDVSGRRAKRRDERSIPQRDDSPEPTVEERRDEGKEIVEEGNRFSDDL